MVLRVSVFVFCMLVGLPIGWGQTKGAVEVFSEDELEVSFSIVVEGDPIAKGSVIVREDTDAGVVFRGVHTAADGSMRRGARVEVSVEGADGALFVGAAHDEDTMCLVVREAGSEVSAIVGIDLESPEDPVVHTVGVRASRAVFVLGSTCVFGASSPTLYSVDVSAPRPSVESFEVEREGLLDDHEARMSPVRIVHAGDRLLLEYRSHGHRHLCGVALDAGADRLASGAACEPLEGSFTRSSSGFGPAPHGALTFYGTCGPGKGGHRCSVVAHGLEGTSGPRRLTGSFESYDPTRFPEHYLDGRSVQGISDLFVFGGRLFILSRGDRMLSVEIDAVSLDETFAQALVARRLVGASELEFVPMGESLYALRETRGGSTLERYAWDPSSERLVVEGGVLLEGDGLEIVDSSGL